MRVYYGDVNLCVLEQFPSQTPFSSPPFLCGCVYIYMQGMLRAWQHSQKHYIRCFLAVLCYRKTWAVGGKVRAVQQAALFSPPEWAGDWVIVENTNLGNEFSYSDRCLARTCAGATIATRI